MIEWQWQYRFNEESRPASEWEDFTGEPIGVGCEQGEIQFRKKPSFEPGWFKYDVHISWLSSEPGPHWRRITELPDKP